MQNDQNDKIKEIARQVAEGFVKNYKCPIEDAHHFFYTSITGNAELSKLIGDSKSQKQLQKSALFKEQIKKFKKELYFNLRKYKGGDDEKASIFQSLLHTDDSEQSLHGILELLASFHVSTQEREAQNDLFYNQMAPHLDAAKSIIDVGCGIQPLFFPHQRFSDINTYLALDKDREAVQLMEKVKEKYQDRYQWLQPGIWNISEGWKSDSSSSIFDLALLLKLVPVVKRVEPGLLEILAEIPARKIIISGVKESMVKKRDIEHRERRAILGFIEGAGRTIENEFEIDNEFFIVVS